MSALARAVRTARRQRGWTQGELAARLKVSQGAISFWENNIEVPSLEHHVQLVEAMPEILTVLAQRELNLLKRLQALERLASGGKCNCSGCQCAGEETGADGARAAAQA